MSASFRAKSPKFFNLSADAQESIHGKKNGIIKGGDVQKQRNGLLRGKEQIVLKPVAKIKLFFS